MRRKKYLRLIPNGVSSETARRLAVEEQFVELAQQWRYDTLPVSDMVEKLENKSYKKIIELGKEHPDLIMRLILDELRKSPDHWFRALREISKENPAQSSDNFKGKVSAWIEWGKGKGFIR